MSGPRQLPKTSLVAPIHNGGPHYPVCFKSLCRLDYPPDRLEVHIIDDGSTDGTREFLLAQVPPPFIHIHCLPENIGLGGARNYGLQYANGEVVILLDGDMVVAPDYVDEHVAELAKTGREAIIGRIAPADWVPRTKLNRYLYEYPYRGARQYGLDKPVEFQFLLSSNTAFSRAAIETAGGRHEPFTHYGGEETIFAYQIARKFPGGIFYSNKPVAYHHEDRPLGPHLNLLRDYGYHNLPLIVSRHPEIATALAADFAWPLAGSYFRCKRALGRLLFNPVTYSLSRALLPITPFPISNALVRFLIVAAVVQGLRKHVRNQKGLLPDPG